MLNKLIVIFSGIVLAFGINVVTMIYGWGISPQSWPVIVACAMASFVVAVGVSAAS